MATQKFVVTGEQYRKVDRRMREIKRQLDQENGSPLDPDWVAGKLQEIVEPEKPWLGQILANEQAYHVAFFGQEFDLTNFVNTLKKYDESKVLFWQKLGLEPHFLPGVSLGQNDNYPGWKIKPETRFYKAVAVGKILRQIGSKLAPIDEVKLEGITVLIDTRLKPVYKGGKQMWANDEVLGSIIEWFRKNGKIAKYEHGPQSSRFGVSADEWEKEIKLAWAEKIDLDLNQVRLERAIEANVIPQIYSYMPRRDDGKTNTWIWYEEYFGARGLRLNGGNSVIGGLADVRYHAAVGHWDDRSFRPLAVL